MEDQINKGEWIDMILSTARYHSSEARHDYVKRYFLEKFDHNQRPMTDNQRNCCYRLINSYKNTNEIDNEEFYHFLNMFELEDLEFAGL